ncbi:hypothetical protein EVAR_267_1 [Eumeta japonica]|uniref:Uncharacterized protein n=1 Tax=Eumeta variegata TaxID=151549 RepID=A0A4C1S965_EUMVA|nr:hypothetical protein EVAR_267_1 [Eumeta japonica]
MMEKGVGCRRGSGVMERRVNHRNTHSLDELHQWKVLLHVRILAATGWAARGRGRGRRVDPPLACQSGVPR